MMRAAAATGATLLGAGALLYAAVARAADTRRTVFPQALAWIEGPDVAAGWYDVTEPDAAFRDARGDAPWEPGVLRRSGEVGHGDHVTLLGPWALVAPRAAAGPDTGSEVDDPGGKAETARFPARPVSLNTATVDALIALPGIGPALARRIVQGRPYRTVSDLDRVKGIGPRKLAALRGRVIP